MLAMLLNQEVSLLKSFTDDLTAHSLVPSNKYTPDDWIGMNSHNLHTSLPLSSEDKLNFLHNDMTMTSHGHDHQHSHSHVMT